MNNNNALSRWKAVWGSLLLMVSILTVPIVNAQPISYGANPTATGFAFFVNNANWADIHYELNSGAMIPVRMAPAGGNNTFSVGPLRAGDRLRYRFLYWDRNCVCQTFSDWSTLTFSGPSSSRASVSSTPVASSVRSSSSIASYDPSGLGTVSKGIPNNFSGIELPCLNNQPRKNGYCMIWNDEFEGSALDISKWSLENNCFGGGNNEAQCYVRNRDNTFVSGGNLVIKAIRQCTYGPQRHDDQPNYDPNDTLGGGMYTSGRLRSLYKGDFKYGRIEMRAKLPEGQGTWPAFWMLPSDWVYGGWAASGEIDIMEAVNLKVGGESRVHGTLHYGDDWPRNVYSGSEYRLPGGINPADGFHEYAIEWEEGEIRWYVDGDHWLTQKSTGWYTNTDLHNPFAPFNQRFHILLNLAVGGSWAGNTNNHGVDPSVFPQEMQVDYVRVYQCENNRSTGKGCASTDGNFIVNPGSTKPEPLDLSRDIPIFTDADVAPFSYGFWAWPGAVHGRVRSEPGRGNIMNFQFDADNGVAYFGVNRKTDLSTHSAIEFDMRVTQDTRAVKSPVEFRADCFDPCRSAQVPLEYSTEWRRYSIPIADLAATGLNTKAVNTPFVITTKTGNQKGLQVQVDNIVVRK